jgi:actin
LNELSWTLVTFAEREIARDVKEKLGYVALDYTKELQTEPSVVEKAYETSSRERLPVGHERFRCTEPMFQPHLIGRDMLGLHHLVSETVRRCDPDIRRDLCSNIVLGGGNTMFPGLAERLQAEVTALVSDGSIDVKVVAPPERKYSAWIGGSILASLSDFASMCISKEEYDEQGPSIVHRKCF